MTKTQMFKKIKGLGGLNFEEFEFVSDFDIPSSAVAVPPLRRMDRISDLGSKPRLVPAMLG